MKTAIYIEDGVVQLVLTPEGKFERNALSSFYEKQLQVKIINGRFYNCQGGWTRQEDVGQYGSATEENSKSLILRIDEQAPTEIEESK